MRYFILFLGLVLPLMAAATGPKSQQSCIDQLMAPSLDTKPASVVMPSTIDLTDEEAQAVMAYLDQEYGHDQIQFKLDVDPALRESPRLVLWEPLIERLGDAYQLLPPSFFEKLEIFLSNFSRAVLHSRRVDFVRAETQVMVRVTADRGGYHVVRAFRAGSDETGLHIHEGNSYREVEFVWAFAGRGPWAWLAMN